MLLSRRGGRTFIRWRHDTWSEQNIVQPLKTPMAMIQLQFRYSGSPLHAGDFWCHRFSQLTEQHQAVIDAIFAGDADGARKAMMARAVLFTPP